MKTYVSPEHLYFSEVLGVHSVILPREISAAGPLSEVVEQVIDCPQGWNYSGTAEAPLLCIDHSLRGSEANELLKKMMAAISIFSFYRAQMTSATDEAPKTQVFSGKYGVVFGEVAFKALGSRHIYGSVIGKFIHFNGINILVTREIDEMFEEDSAKRVKAEVWHHLKRLREVMRASY